MKHSLVKLSQAALSLMVVLCFLATAIGQTDSCSQIVRGSVGFLPAALIFASCSFAIPRRPTWSGILEQMM